MTNQSARPVYIPAYVHEDPNEDPASTVGLWGTMIDTHGDCTNCGVPHKWQPLPGFTKDEYDRYARWACHRCPVIAACGMYAIATGRTDGIYGGTAQDRLIDIATERDQAAQLDRTQRADRAHTAQAWPIP